MVGIVTGQGEGTVMCVPCSPEPYLHEKVTINVVSSDKVAWAGTQWGHAGLSLSEAADWLLSPVLTQSPLFPRDML